MLRVCHMAVPFLGQLTKLWGGMCLPAGGDAVTNSVKRQVLQTDVARARQSLVENADGAATGRLAEALQGRIKRIVKGVKGVKKTRRQMCPAMLNPVTASPQPTQTHTIDSRGGSTAIRRG
ncbi:hypothetical protein CDEST_06896 [Colletotrichum destructivum]|uniref:Uncharacterized protein n=1 Tax=Colletotrichum destructivum TaxID=34406 RepID=A0AAX4IES7_9PEZI|nr:hypothetical protein CDEST_06896 [Colletotrichum destructivum]